jgi:aminopeptidase N
MRRFAVPVAVCLFAVVGCGGGSSGTAKAPRAAPRPSTARPAALRASQPHITHPTRRLNRPPYHSARSDPRVDNQYPAFGTTSLDVLHYGLDLTWHASSRQLVGIARIRFRSTRNESGVQLDLAASMHVSRVRFDNRSVHSTHRGPVLTIATGPITNGSRHPVTIRYAGTPKPYQPPKRLADLAGLGWHTEPDGQAWTIQEPFGGYTWYPVNDQPSDKAFYDITWHTQSTWTGISNGQLTADTVAHGVRSTHWMLDSPAASYLITAAIGPYDEYTQTGPHGLPLTYWVRPVDRATLPILQRSPALLTWLEQRLGPLPFVSLGDVVVPTHSAVETQTMVTMGAPILTATDATADLVHEYIHQWYGDEITPSTWKDLWLNESFAYYLQLLWEASHGVTTTAAWRAMLEHDDQRLRTEYGPPGNPKPAQFASLNVYECGARMLDRLRKNLGAAAFGRLLRGWPARHRFGNAARGNWVAYLNHVSGRDYSGFAARWLLSAHSPS